MRFHAMRPLLLLTFLLSFHAAATDGTRLLAEPAVSDRQVAFVYDNDLWLVARDGGTARRLTSAAGREHSPAFSPDGRWLAFSAPYAGADDVYIMPAEGGAARRLTWHPGDEIVRGFTPDGQSVLFESPRSVHSTRLRHLYTVPVDGSAAPRRLPVPTGFKAAFSPDGRYIAYTPNAEAFAQWKNYRGGTMSRIWIMDLADYAVTEVPRPAGGANDSDPMWVGDRLYFRSDRDGEFNLYRFDPDTGGVTGLTEYDDFPVISPAAAPDGVIVFEQAGWLHQLNTATGHTHRLTVTAVSDLKETRERQVSEPRWVRWAAPAPDLSRVALEYRGAIVTVPAERGDPRVISSDSGSHARSPVWSPDGAQLAWFSDAGGEYALWTGAQDGRGEPRRIALDGAGFYDQPLWSPDGARIAYRDNSQSLWVVELASGRTTKVAQEPVYTPLNMITAAWSPDSRWLAYTVQQHGLIRTVYAWSVASGESVRITDGLSEMAAPVFDPNGEFLYVLASTDAGPLKDWFSQASADMQKSYGVYAITLRADGPSPLPPLSDEVNAGDDNGNGKGNGNGNDAPPRVRIDADGIADRIVALPLPAVNRRDLQVGASGELYWIENAGLRSFEAFGADGKLVRFTLAERESKTLADGISAFVTGAKGKKILYRKNNDWFVTEIKDKLPGGEGKLALDRVQIRVEPRAEWAQIFNEVWRINRDWFYDPGFHGADWDAMREKYQPFLAHLATRHDLDRVIRWMLSELSVGHSYLSPGDYINRPEGNPAGLLGADYEVVDGRYRFARIYGGLNWNPDLRSPLRTPGVDVREGQYLIAVNGQELRAPDSVHRPFAGLAGRQVVITVADNAAGRNAREVTVVPLDSEVRLRYLAWLEGNIRYVHERSDGRIAYVHVPNTATVGHEMFKRYFYPQSHKDALIIDERYNGGGQIADYYIDIMRRDYIAHWTMRYGQDLISPRAAILGPKVMITDETAGSGGDLLPWMFQRFELGPVVGKTTWGGLVGILGFPVLRDGGSITAPNIAFWTEADGFAVENEGVTPDIEVEQWPAEVNAGRDPQLDRAIDEALRMLEAHPPRQHQRPDYPVRAR